MESSFELYKDRFNVSAACQAAIETELAYHKAVDEVTEEKQITIARLIKERDDMKNAAYQSGKTEGVSEVLDLSYSELELIAELWEQGIAPMDILSSLTKELGSSLEDDTIDYLKNQDSYGRSQYQSYVRGWLESAIDLFHSVEAA
jgi:hypothetical protein